MSTANTSWPVLAAPAVLWLLFVIAYTSLEWTSLGNLEMKDTDDYVRLHQSEEYVRTKQWYNFTLPRMNPPAGTPMHWSRLPDLPLATILTALRPLVGDQRAVFIALIVVPSLLLLMTLYLLWIGLRSSSQPQAASIAVFYVLICLPVASKVAPGKLDHHGWQIMLLAALWAATAIGARGGRSLWAGIVAGSVTAASLWVGLEVLPLLMAIVLYVHLEWIFGNNAMARFGCAFGLSLSVACIAVLILHVPASQRFVASCDTYALNWLRMAWAVAVVCIVLPLFGARWSRPAQRFVISVTLAVFFSVVVLSRDASCIFLGPYADMPERLHEQLLAKIYEARSAFTLAAQSPGMLVIFLGFPAVILVVALFERVSLQRDAVCRLSFVLALCAFCVSLWQIRAAYFAGLFAVPLAAILAQSLISRNNARFSALAPSLCVMLLLSPMVSLLLGVAMERRWGSEDASAVNELSVEQIDAALAVIDEQPNYRAPALALVAAPINAGPAILARSRHAILAAPYHRNHGGVIKWLDIRAAQDELSFRRLVLDANVDFLLLPNLRQVSASASLMEQLAAGKRVAWLRRLPTSAADDTLLFHVLAESTGRTEQQSTSAEISPLINADVR